MPCRSSQRGTPMSRRTWPLPASSTAPRAVCCDSRCAIAASRANWPRASAGHRRRGNAPQCPSSISRSCAACQAASGASASRHARTRSAPSTALEIVARQPAGGAARQVAGQQRQLVLQRQRNEHLVVAPAPAGRARGLRDHVLGVAGPLAARAVDVGLTVEVELLHHDRRAPAAVDGLAQRALRAAGGARRCRAPRRAARASTRTVAPSSRSEASPVARNRARPCSSQQPPWRAARRADVAGLDRVNRCHPCPHCPALPTPTPLQAHSRAA